MALCGERRINDTFHTVLPRVTRLLNYIQPSWIYCLQRLIIRMHKSLKRKNSEGPWFKSSNPSPTSHVWLRLCGAIEGVFPHQNGETSTPVRDFFTTGNISINCKAPEMYSRVCTIEVDLSHLTRNTKDIKKRGPKGKYYRLDYEVALLFGLTELKAQLIWKEKVPFFISHVWVKHAI